MYIHIIYRVYIIHYEITENNGVILIVNKILIISATNDKNLVLAKELGNIISNMNIQTELLSVQDLGLPLFDFEKDLNNNVIDDLIDKLQKSSGFVICAPEYNGGVPPVLSNVITWISVRSKQWTLSLIHI